MNKKQLILLHLSLIKGVGPAAVQRMLYALGSFDRFEELYRAHASDFIRMGFSPKRAQEMVHGLSDTREIENELRLIEKHACTVITRADEDYPEGLSHISSPPVVVYVQGSAIPAFQSCLAVVGSRDANRYGQRAIELLIPDLVSHGFSIVSGGALGADSMAHRATLAAAGRTLVVLGSGLLKASPVSNQRLFDDIIDAGGSLVSIFSLEEGANPGNFPARNRIISGLSSGCVVIQAAEHSGARITAQCALDQGRSVFAVPGSIEDPLSAGCHDLILQGATLVRSAADILADQQYSASHISKPSFSDESRVFRAPVSFHPLQKIITACTEARSFDELRVELNLSDEVLQEALWELQLEGLLSQDFTGLWMRS